MPPSDPPDNNPYWCGYWPVTIARINNFQTAFRGAPSRRVPFGLHSIKYLRHLLEAACAQAGTTVEEVEAAYGNADPSDAPWIVEPRKDTWKERMAQYEKLPVNELTHTRPIPYADKAPPDAGTEHYPEWENYEEQRHDRSAFPTSPEMADERQLREREAQRGMDMGDEVAKEIEREAQQESDEDEFLGGMFG